VVSVRIDQTASPDASLPLRRGQHRSPCLQIHDRGFHEQDWTEVGLVDVGWGRLSSDDRLVGVDRFGRRPNLRERRSLGTTIDDGGRRLHRRANHCSNKRDR
jgi:hypothetical protein